MAKIFGMDVLSKEKFQASNWLDVGLLSSPLPRRSNLPPTLAFAANTLPQERDTFFPPQFLVTGWQGDSLITRAGLGVRNILQELLPTAQECFTQVVSNFGRSRSMAIYQEFLAFEQEQQHQALEINSPAALGQHLRLGARSAYAADLQEFARLYALRTIIVYAFKIRFITHLCQALHILPRKEILLAPQSFLAKIFKAGSSTELICAALRTGAYSWYLPKAQEENLVQQLAQNLSELSLTELIKVCTYVPGQKGMEDPAYSHTLSHREFGLFLHNLLLTFPAWMEKGLGRDKDATIINCHFAGDYVAAMALGNWLAQESLLAPGHAPTTLISSHLPSGTFANGTFGQACQELHFLTFLVQAAGQRKADPVKFISEVMRQKYAASEQGQMSMFPEWEPKAHGHFPRIVLMAAKLPAKNPHYYLLQQIQGQLDTLSDHGQMYVFSNQNLFVPSQSDKIERLLQKVNVDACFNFEELKGRGEIPAFLYVLTKSSSNKSSSPRTWGEQQLAATCARQKACASFKWSGALKSFYHFHELNTVWAKFLAEHDPAATWVYQENVGDSLDFEFNQDAIIDGRFLSSQNGDPRRLTHPKFFRNLVNSCVTLDHFFLLEQIRPEDFSSPTATAQELLGVAAPREARYPLAIIVDYSRPSIQLELVERDALLAKMENYGQAFFQYFGLLPKITSININIFREFFQTNLGQQIIQLALAGGPTKMKAKLAALLIPKFFLSTTLLPSAAPTTFALLSMDNLLAMDAPLLQSAAQEAAVLADQYQTSYPWHVLSEIAQFKYQVFLALSSLREGRQSDKPINFQHPVILRPLLQAKLQEIYPRNQDLFVDFNLQSPQDIHRPLDRISLNANGRNYVLRLYSEEMEILKLYGPQNILSFLAFIFGQAKGVSISQLLAQTKTPAAAELDRIVEDFKRIEDTLALIYQQLSSIISSLIMRHLSGQVAMNDLTDHPLS